MFQRLNHRAGHYALLIAVTLSLTLPNLGVPSLWDIDEGNNAEAAREMFGSENWSWIVPTFNYQPRVDKPALLYWLQIAAYRLFGIDEFAARLPSALAALATVLLIYEFGRSLFNAPTGLLAGLILASAAMFCASAHFANPDALLNAFTVLTFFLFWRSFSRGGRGWFVPAGVSAGFAVLAKGPVGLALPGAVIGLFLFWSGRLRLLLDRRLLAGALAFALVALPWYIWVGAETRGEFLRGFLLVHNLSRYLHPMEGHHGPLYYYAAALLLGFLPWSVFLGPAGWHALRGVRRPTPDRAAAADPCSRHACRLLWCWIGVYFVFFSLAGTKLPNYILPIYAPVALFSARFLHDWQRGEVKPLAWVMPTSLALFALVGLAAAVGLLVAGDAIQIPLRSSRRLPGLEAWAFVGALPILGAVAAWWCVRRGHRAGVLVSVAAPAVAFVACLAAGATVAVDAYKAPRPLVRTLQGRRTEPDIRVGCYEYFQPSLVFYCQREVLRLPDAEKALEFLRCPLPIYLFLPASHWEGLKARAPASCRLIDRHGDFYQGREVVLVTNR